MFRHLQKQYSERYKQVEDHTILYINIKFLMEYEIDCIFKGSDGTKPYFHVVGGITCPG